ncbi:uncharacterized protein BKA78DRAFT_281835 [Phyllosticta capitalensis]|uniref:uncharacterized protein n=1 Tax=Phyllosticta capitalensis TaxID=121624 RepID=UPI00312E6E02
MGATEDEEAVEKRGLVKTLTSIAGVDSLSKQISKATSTSAILNLLVSAAPGAAPQNETALQSSLKSIWGTTPSNFYSALSDQILAGIVPALDLTSLSTIVDPTSGPNSVINDNPKEPAQPVYPQKGVKDAPYLLSEQELRQIIQFPEGFTYGQKQPVIFVSGTGVYGYEAFQNNLIKLLTGVDYADPVWINIPKASIPDAQINSEYVAYAINYIAGITNRNVSVITYSQGGPNAQWALTFWPSTRDVVSNFFPVSPDFHGTLMANLLCLNFGGASGLGPCDPSVLQQEYTSDWVKALLAKDQASAWVPTTTFYSGLLDEIVQPQSGSGASAYRFDIRHVGVTNNEAQLVCPGQLAGSFYGHAGMLYNPITFALIQDALTNGGPGQTKRLDLDTVCAPYVAPGLTLTDAVLTSATILLSGLRILAYFPKYLTEPALMAYVNNDVS